MIFGDKCSRYDGTIVIYDKANKLKAVINMDKGTSGLFETRPTDIFKGFLYKAKNGIFKRYKR